MNDLSHNPDLARDETDCLISASKVEGTAVYDSNGEKIGSIDEVMIDKYSGEVTYAVMSFGGFLGIGEKYHPLPWNVLDYDKSVGGYRVGMAGEGFRDAPHFDRGQIGGLTGRHADVDQWYDRAAGEGRYRQPRRELPQSPAVAGFSAAAVPESRVLGGAGAPAGASGGEAGMTGAGRQGL